MKSVIGFTALLIGAACSLPPVDPFAGAESAIKSRQLLVALKHLEAVPVDDPRYHDARVVAGQVEQRIRRSHESVLEALRLRAEWRDTEALHALHQARLEWPGQPDLDQWITATRKRLELFGYGTPKAFLAKEQEAMSADPSEIAAEGVSSPLASAKYSQGDLAALRFIDRDSQDDRANDVPVPVSPEVVDEKSGLLPVTSTNPDDLSEQLPDGNGLASPTSQVASLDRPADSSALPAEEPQVSIRRNESEPSTSKTDDDLVSVEDPPTSEPAVVVAPIAEATPEAKEKPAVAAINETERPPLSDDPVALGLVLVEARIGVGALDLAVFDLVELWRRFPNDRRVRRRVIGLLHQRALMHYGRGQVGAAVADWRFLLEMDPGNRAVEKMVTRTLRESAQASKYR